jgi:Flp pilus assembly protein TadB
VFGRRTSEPADTVESLAKNEGKGRPTPTRKEAEAARKQRLTSARDRKSSGSAARRRASEQRAKVRQAMETGDERYLPQRDRGPVKKFVRDYIDSRRTIGEYLLVIFFVALAIGFVSPAAAGLSSWAFLVILVAMAADSIRIVRGVKTAIRKRFGDKQTESVTMYAVMRAWQMRRLRLPKPQVKHGDPV